LHVCFYDILICLVGDFDFFSFSFSWYPFALFESGTVHWNHGGNLISAYGQLQSGSDILLYEIVSYTTIILTLYISLRTLFLFSSSVHRRLGFFFFQVHISFPSFGDCSYYDYGMLIVSICLINLLFSLRTKFPRIFLFHLLFISVPFLSWVYLGRKERKIGWGSK